RRYPGEGHRLAPDPVSGGTAPAVCLRPGRPPAADRLRLPLPGPGHPAQRRDGDGRLASVQRPSGNSRRESHLLGWERAVSASRTGRPETAEGGDPMKSNGLDLKSVRRWKRYPEYRPCQAEWLRPLPAHWKILPLKRRVRIRYG